MAHSSLVEAPDALTCLMRGFDKLAALLALTLGPRQGSVISAQSGQSPELLTDAGIIARRITELPGRGQDAGAMICRNMVWQMHERHGDGGAVAAVLANAMIHEAAPMIAAGANPMLIRRGMERGLAAAKQALAAQAQQIGGQEMLGQLATSVTGDAELGKILGEMFDLLGKHTALSIEEYVAPHLDREYLEGGRWRAVPAARALMPERQTVLTLENPLVLVVDERLERLDQVRTLLELAAAAPMIDGAKPPLLLLARHIGGEALNTISINHHRGAFTIGAVNFTVGSISDDLGDIAVMTGGDVIADVLGRPPQNVRPSYFGHARRAMITRDSLTIIGGAGDRQTIQTRIGELRAQNSRLNRSDKAWEQLRMRVARLAGGVGIVKIGAYTERERMLRKELAQKAVLVLEQVLDEGVIPGGGVAYLQCAGRVAAMRAECNDSDEAAGVDVVAKALRAPLKQLVRNHGALPPNVALHEIQQRGGNVGFDVGSGDYVCMSEAGILDSVAIAVGAIEAAVSAAAMIITTDVVVLSSDRRRKLSLKP